MPRDRALTRLATASAIALGASALACGILDDDDLDLTYTEEIPASFTIDAEAACAGVAGCDQTGSVESPREQALAPIEIDLQIDVEQSTGRDDLSEYSGRFKAINITRVAYAVPSNDLTFDLPPVTLYLGPPGADSTTSAGVTELATIPAIPASQTVDSADAPIATENAPAHSELLQDLDLSALLAAAPSVKMGQPFPPGGAAELEVTLYVTFVANPADAL